MRLLNLALKALQQAAAAAGLSKLSNKSAYLYNNILLVVRTENNPAAFKYYDVEILLQVNIPRSSVYA